VRLQDKVTIITGAGGGMGRTAARMFAAEGARVVCVDVTEEMAESAAADVRTAGGEATAVAADVSKEDEARRMVDRAVATYGRVDALYTRARARSSTSPRSSRSSAAPCPRTPTPPRRARCCP
jgi:NAD(P)-dependent dehydrogenase (short-subunit alcohol dehydrogenase family)